MTTPPITEEWAQHPGLNLALDGLSVYANWVSRVVMPIAFQWIHEKEHAICKEHHWKRLPDDMDQVIKAAFELVQKEDYYKEGKEAFDKFHKRMELNLLEPEETKEINETWAKVSRRFRKQVCEEFDRELELELTAK